MISLTLTWSFILVFIWTYQVELIDPAVKGTLNVLASCAKISSIERVVVTSSMAAVAYNRRTRAPDVVVDETWFSDADACKEAKVVPFEVWASSLCLFVQICIHLFFSVSLFTAFSTMMETFSLLMLRDEKIKGKYIIPILLDVSKETRKGNGRPSYCMLFYGHVLVSNLRKKKVSCNLIILVNQNCMIHLFFNFVYC